MSVALRLEGGSERYTDPMPRYDAVLFAVLLGMGIWVQPESVNAVWNTPWSLDARHGGLRVVASWFVPVIPMPVEVV